MALKMQINRNIAEMEYAVRGPIPLRAAELQKQGRTTIPCNIGNPQALGQRPISYYRTILSLVEDPSRIRRERQIAESGTVVPIDPHILDIAETIVGLTSTGTGGYTESAGFAFIRQAIARFINQRDDVAESAANAADPDHIFLTNGASVAAKHILEMMISSPTDGIMIPIPQYPLYSATVRKLGGVQINYYPDEEGGWRLDKAMIEAPLKKAQADGVTVKAIVVINPGNPTGAILDEKSVRDVIEVAQEYDLAIIADEVYQENHYGQPWVSFAQVLGTNDVSLFSLHSVSKGFTGECGHRGGYLEVRNPPSIGSGTLSFIDVLIKQASVALCSNTVGQLLTYLMVRPPDSGTGAFAVFDKERQAVLDDLHEKATIIQSSFASMNGVEVFGRIGAMYLFPRLSVLPAGKTDFDYCMALLEQTGLCTVNGSGFGQAPGTNHLRIAFLPPKEMLEEVLPQWIDFHNRYVG